MICNCSRNLESTENVYTADTGLRYKISICYNCKRYFIKRFLYLHEVEYDYKTKHWNETKYIVKIDD